MLQGEVEERELPSGAITLVSKDYPEIDEARLRSVAESTRDLLGR
jgi:hypothetical protein